jgi:Fe2+ or Zn2+ uptake regulation protein
MNIHNDHIKSILDQAHLKRTSARIKLLSVLAHTKMPLSVKSISEKLAKNHIDKVTVYRILEMFTKKGILRRVDTGNPQIQYELADASEDHHHIICLECKKVSDFTGCESENLIAKALQQVKDFKSISYHSFDLFGLCSMCAKK